MSAIGTSPCPPFNRNSLVPGILYDGNTVAWYKHNDPVAGVIKDGANRVSFWLDKMNYGIGAELVNQAAWYTVAYWDVAFNANWSQAGVTLSSDGNNGFVARNNFWTLGATYKITISITVAGGNITPPFASVLPTALALTGTYTYYYTPSIDVRLWMSSQLFNGTVTALSIKEVTGKHLLQATAASQPLWSAANGVLFDGVNDFMKATAFAFVQPEFIYFVGRHITWTNNDYFYDGDNIPSSGLVQFGLVPSIVNYAGVVGVLNSNLVLNTFSIIRSLFNGVTSFVQVNKTASVIGNIGASNMNSFTLGANGLNADCSNIEVKEIILRKSADNAATQDAIYNYLKNINSVP